jgi:hypothetical protein
MIPTKYMELPIDVISGTQQMIFNPYISSSYYRNIKSLKMQVDTFIANTKKEASQEEISLITAVNNPYSFLPNVISSETVSRSSETDNSQYFKLFFILIELCNTFDFLHRDLYQYPTYTIYVGNNGQSFQNGINFISNKVDTGIYTCSLDDLLAKVKNNDSSVNITEVKTIFFDIEIAENDYTYSVQMLNELLKTLYIILNIRCSCIIKTGGFIFKPFIDILYILTATYKSVYISKPIVVQDVNDRYVICKDPYTISPGIDYITTTNEALQESIDFTGFPRNIPITSIVSSPLSHHFLTKIEESTLIIGQKNIENYESLIVLLKMIGKEEKLENAKKSALMKCVQWCGKYNIPHSVGCI